MSILVTKNLKKYYGSGETLVKALDGVDLAIEKGEFVSVVGRSGSGKSTLLHMLGGLDIPTSGEVIVADQNLGAMKKDALTIFRRREIGFVFQDYNLLPLLNVYENIVLPIQLDGGKPDRGFVEDLLNTLGIREKKFAMPNALSGGQQQRVAIARALAAKPSILLADEPTGNLDEETAGGITELLRLTAHEMGKCVIVVTHSRALAEEADQVLEMKGGRLKAQS